MNTCSCIDIRCPKTTEIALFTATVYVCVHSSFQEGWASKTDLCIASPLVPLYFRKETVTALYMLCTSFYAWHILVIWEKKPDRLNHFLWHSDIATLIATYFS